MSKLIKGFAALMLCGCALYATAFAGARITVKGSDTLVILAQRWAETYMKRTPGVKVQVTGGGSGVGIAALINGTTDICDASRAMKPAEIKRCERRWKKTPEAYPCAKDGITLYIHPSNPVKGLTLAQLKDIYTGKVGNWSQVGGGNGKIVRYSRENNSGTYVYFKEHVLQKADYDATCQNMPGTAAIVNAVAKDPAGIGYGGVAYATGVKKLPVKKDAASPAYLPTEAYVKSGKYPISRSLYMYTRGPATGEVKKYIDWMLSKEGQKVVSKVGYFPIR